MVPDNLEVVDGEVVLASTEHAIDVDGVPVDLDKAADAVRRCVTAIGIIRSYESTIREDDAQIEMRELMTEVLMTLTGDPDAQAYS